MIQRIQSLFITLVIIIGVVSSFLPVISFSGETGNFIMKHYKTVAASDGHILIKNMGIGVLQGLVLIAAIMMLLLYKNRSTQIKLGKLNLLLIALEIAAIVMYSDAAKLAISANPENVAIQFQWGASIPVLSLVLTYLSIRFIKKDDDLVRSADRLR